MPGVAPVKPTVEPQWDILDGETNTGIIRNWPNIPPNFDIPNYSQFAKHTFELAFSSENKIVNGREILAHTRWADSKAYPSLEPLFKFTTLFQASFIEDLRAKKYPHVSESLAIFPGLISSALLSQGNEENPKRSDVASYVRMMKRYFHPLALTGKPNAGWFANGPHKGSANGGEFWYDLGPNVYAIQLLGLFRAEEIEPANTDGTPIEETFDELCHRMADTIYEMVTALKNGNAAPSFDYRSVKVVDGKFKPYDPDCSDSRPKPEQELAPENRFCPRDFHSIYPKLCSKPRNDPEDPAPWFCFDNSNGYEPDAAGAVAYIGLVAFERWNDPRYFEMADAAIQFLLQYDRNPVYELIYNYGVIAAAKMNKEYGTSYDIKKLTRYAFVRSDKKINPNVSQSGPDISTNARPDVGVINEMWGNYPAYGLWGAKIKGAYQGYAFFMNTISQAVTLAPLVKYYPNYAQLFGKYLLHVASNSKYFFSEYVPDSLEDPTTLKALTNRLDLRYRSIPYEGVRKNGSAILLKGDAVQNGWASTDLSIYSGSLTGMFASILIKDAQDSSQSNPIVFWDLNVTDMAREAGFPQYLVYNPTNSKKTATLMRKHIRPYGGTDFSGAGYIKVWDSTRNQWVARTSGDVTLELPAGEAAVLALVPEDYTCSEKEKRLICSDSGSANEAPLVVDYSIP
jgi:hypothetical protein